MDCHKTQAWPVDNVSFLEQPEKNLIPEIATSKNRAVTPGRGFRAVLRHDLGASGSHTSPWPLMVLESKRAVALPDP